VVDVMDYVHLLTHDVALFLVDRYRARVAAGDDIEAGHPAVYLKCRGTRSNCNTPVLKVCFAERRKMA
jgi:hypothetical protein